MAKSFNLFRSFRRAGLLTAVGATFLCVAWLPSAPAVAQGVPLGFRVLGTRVPAHAESERIPAGWTEQFLETNRTLPKLTEAETHRGYFDTRRAFRRVVNAGGVAGGAACPRAPAFWDYMARALEILAAVEPPIDGAVIDTETYNAGTIYPGYGALEYRCCYCDSRSKPWCPTAWRSRFAWSAPLTTASSSVTSDRTTTLLICSICSVILPCNWT